MIKFLVLRWLIPLRTSRRKWIAQGRVRFMTTVIIKETKAYPPKTATDYFAYSNVYQRLGIKNSLDSIKY